MWENVFSTIFHARHEIPLLLKNTFVEFCDSCVKSEFHIRKTAQKAYLLYVCTYIYIYIYTNLHHNFLINNYTLIFQILQLSNIIFDMKLIAFYFLFLISWYINYIIIVFLLARVVYLFYCNIQWFFQQGNTRKISLNWICPSLEGRFNINRQDGK